MPIKFVFNPLSGNFDEISTVALGAVGSSPNANAASISASQVLTLQPADATNPGIVTAGTQTIGGSKTFTGLLKADGGIDVTATGGSDILNIGTSAADVINIGNSGATINIQGTTFFQNVTNLAVSDKLFTINVGGSVASGNDSGFEIEENAVITGYIKTSGDRNSWLLKAPNTAGIVTITPGASGFTINQGSHDPVTLGAFGSTANANGASLSGQVLTLQPASGSFPGGLSTGTQTISGPKTFTSAITSDLIGNVTGNVSGTSANVTGVVAIANGGTGQTTKAAAFDALSPMTTGGDLIYGGASGTGTRLANGTVGQVLTSAGGTAAPTWSSGSTFVAPTIQKFTTGSGTYTTPTSPRTPLYIRIRLVGGGGAGGGGGTTPTGGGTGGNGGNTTFGSTVVVGNAGTGGGGGSSASNGTGGAGGSASLSGSSGSAFSGGSGGDGDQNSIATVGAISGYGASSPLGGGAGASAASGTGRSAAANTGSGGAGAGAPASTNAPGGGGAGGYADAIVTSPSATYAYAVGAAGTAGTAGTAGSAGGAGAAGYIEVTEYYQ